MLSYMDIPDAAHNNTDNNQSIQTIDTNSVIYNNPIHDGDQCRNAIIIKDDINISNLGIYSCNIIWSREYLSLCNDELHKNYAFRSNQYEISMEWW